MKKLLLPIFAVLTLTVTAQKNVGIDQPNPNAKLHITQNGATDALKVETNDTTGLLVDSTGKVGVMTSNPTAELEVNGRIKDKTGFVTPVGVAFPYFGTTAPEGWLLCDGSEVSRTTYADLFAVLGTSCGEGDGSTTFNLPDTRGMFLRGVDNGAGNDPDAAGRTAQNTNGNSGDNVGSVQNDQFKSHDHGGGNHRHGNDVSSLLTTGAGTQAQKWTNGNTTPRSGGSLSWFTNYSGNTINSNGGNETRPINLYVNYIIKY